jgi:NagD protein
MGLRSAQTVMIGDTMETDILGGVQMGYKTVLVLSGGTEKSALGRYAYQPEVVVDSIAHLDTNELFLEHVAALREPARAAV